MYNELINNKMRKQRKCEKTEDSADDLHFLQNMEQTQMCKK